MPPKHYHSWDLTEEQALALQYEWSKKVNGYDDFDEIKTVAGVDVAYSEKTGQVVAAVAVLDANILQPLQIVYADLPSTFPYIPGLFSFRELPAVMKAFEQLQILPDLVVCDGQGYAHPRRFGLACHLGVMLDIPTLGAAKSRFIGEYQEPASTRGSQSYLMDNEEIVGAVLRTQTSINPIFVSIGHRIALSTACDWVLRLANQYRLPETTRCADHAVRERLIALETS
jgi:deoxyribonuclease V